MALLKSTDYDEVKGDDKEVVSKQDLDRLLDRSDLHEQWLVKKNGVSEGQLLIVVTCCFLLVMTLSQRTIWHASLRRTRQNKVRIHVVLIHM